jgi:hypothetical protein
MNTNRPLVNRRNFLRCAGIGLALPWMETFADTKEPAAKMARFVSIYHPDGVGLPRQEDPAWQDWSWFPQGGETDFRLTKVLDVLEPLRNEITIYSGLSHPAVRKVIGHANADQYLTGADTGSEGPYKNSISLDQVIAAHVARHTRHSSLVLSTNAGTGAPRATHTSSFNQQGRPIPSINRPKEIFDLLFVTQGRETRDILARSRSALDLLTDNVHTLNRKLSSHDRDTLQQYLDSVRDTEVKLLKAEQWIDQALPKVDADHLNLEVTVRDSRAYIQTIYELIFLAFLSDSTRVATYMMGRENTGGPQDLLARAVGLNNAHSLTHDVKEPNGWRNLGTYNRFQAEEFGRFLQKLKDTREPNGNGTLLDNTFAMHGSASSSFHLSRNYPILSAGGTNLGFRNGRYLKFGKGNEDNQANAGIADDSGWQSDPANQELPLAHLFVTLLNRMGIETNEFAGYKGGLDGV